MEKRANNNYLHAWLICVIDHYSYLGLVKLLCTGSDTLYKILHGQNGNTDTLLARV